MTRSCTDAVDWAEFFKRHEDYTVLASFYECRRDFSLEELYQMFKARLEHERKTEDAGF